MDVIGDVDQDLDTLIESFEYTNIFIPSYNEAKYITAKTDLKEIAKTLTNYGIKIVIIKLGGSGCYIYSKGEEIRIPSLKVDVVDTTVAGDSFVAGFITAY